MPPSLVHSPMRSARGFSILACVALIGLSAACHRDTESRKRSFVREGDAYLVKKQYPEAILQYRRAVQIDPKFGEARLKLAEAYAATDDVRNALPEYVRAADLLPDNADVQVKAGNLLLLGGRFQDAKTRARNVLKRDPKNVRALVLLGNALAGLRDMDNAVSVAQRATELWPERPGMYSNLGALRLAKGDQDLAEAAFKRAVEVAGQNIPPYIALANFYRGSGRIQQAEQMLRRALAIDARHLQANVSLGSLLVEVNRIADAEPFFTRASEISHDISSQVSLADYYVSAGRPERALAVLNALAKVPKAFAIAKTRIAVVQLSSGHRDAAYRTIDEMLKQAPRDASILSLKARLLLADRRTVEAAALIKDAVAIDTRSPQVQLTLGRVRVAQNDLEGARRAFNEALDADPLGIDAPIELAQLHMQRREIDTSIAFADKGVKTHPESLDAHLTLVRTLTVRSEDYPRAENEVKALLTRYPAQAPVQTAWGNICILNRDPAGARKAFERALELDADHVEAWAGLMVLDAASNHLREMIRRLDARIASSVRKADLLQLMAKAAVLSRDFPRAEQSLKRAIENDSSQLDSYALLGQLYVAQKKLPAATAEFLKMAQLEPTSVAATTMLGLLYDAQQDVAAAETWYERAVQSSPSGAAAAANNLAYLYAERGGNLDVATRLAQTAKAQATDQPQYNDTLGWIYYKRGMIAQSRNTLQSAVDVAPNNAVYQFHLGMALAQAGDDARARAALEHALKLSPRFSGADDARKTLATLVY